MNMILLYLYTYKYLSSNLYQSINYHKAVIFSKHSQYLEPFYIKSHLDIQTSSIHHWFGRRPEPGLVVHFDECFHCQTTDSALYVHM